MIETLQLLVVLLVVIAAVAVLAARLQIPAAILQVIAGVILALVPGLPTVNLPPELVLLLVLPPVIYSSAVAMSWREFRFNLRPISQLAFGCVVFTTVAVCPGRWDSWSAPSSRRPMPSRRCRSRDACSCRAAFS